MDRDYFFADASFAHCQNFSAAGLSRPFSATMTTEIGFGSGVMCKPRGQRAEVTGQRPDNLSDEKPRPSHRAHPKVGAHYRPLVAEENLPDAN